MSRGDQAPAKPGPGAPATFAVECPGCRAHLAATAMLAGGPAVCPTCRTEFLVPRVAPAAAVDAPVVLTEPPLPSTRRRPDDAFVVAEADGNADDASSFAFHDPIRTITAGGTDLELRRLSRDERRRRRAQRTLILLAVGAALLVALVVLLGTPWPGRRGSGVP